EDFLGDLPCGLLIAVRTHAAQKRRGTGRGINRGNPRQIGARIERTKGNSLRRARHEFFLKRNSLELSIYSFSPTNQSLVEGGVCLGIGGGGFDHGGDVDERL